MIENKKLKMDFSRPLTKVRSASKLLPNSRRKESDDTTFKDETSMHGSKKKVEKIRSTIEIVKEQHNFVPVPPEQHNTGI